MKYKWVKVVGTYLNNTGIKLYLFVSINFNSLHDAVNQSLLKGADSGLLMSSQFGDLNGQKGKIQSLN